MKYDVIIIGAGPGGIFAAYELMQQKPDMKVAVFESGHALSKRRCPIDGDKIDSVALIIVCWGVLCIAYSTIVIVVGDASMVGCNYDLRKAQIRCRCTWI